MTAPQEQPDGHTKGLIERLSKGERSNALDVRIEVALFEQDGGFVRAFPNDARTKVIYERADGTRQTHWAPDWSLKPERAIELLRAKEARS